MLSKYDGVMLQGSENFDSIYFKHATAMSIKQMLGDEYDKYFKFTFVRNPWDWIISNYEFNRGLHRPYVKDTNYSVSSKVPKWAKNMTFTAWLAWWTSTFKPSQSLMFTDTNGDLLVDHIFRFESLQSEFERLQKILGIGNGGILLPRLKSSNRRIDYKSYYDDKNIALVQKHFAMDLEELGYPSEP
jgi:hypothetical protein